MNTEFIDMLVGYHYTKIIAMLDNAKACNETGFVVRAVSDESATEIIQKVVEQLNDNGYNSKADKINSYLVIKTEI